MYKNLPNNNLRKASWMFFSLMTVALCFASQLNQAKAHNCSSSTKAHNCSSQPAKKFDIEVGACKSFKEAPLLKTADYSYIEVKTRGFLVPDKPEEDFQKNLKALKKNNLEPYAANSFVKNIRAVGEDADHDKMMEYSEIAFRRAKEAGLKIIVFGSGSSRKITEGYDKEKAKQQFIAMLKRMGPIAAKYDVTLVIEPLNKGECNFINTVAEGAEIARAVNHPNIQLLADFYHMLREGEGPQSIIDAGKLLKHCHIAENIKRASPGTNKEDFTEYFAALKKIGYKGRISVECKWNKKLDQKKELPAALKYTKDQIAMTNKN